MLNNNVINNEKRPVNVKIKKAIIMLTIIFIIGNIFILALDSTLEPGGGMTIMLIAPFVWAMWLFCIVYFTILAMKFAREKNNMHRLDKMEFYILLFYFTIFFSFTMINNL